MSNINNARGVYYDRKLISKIINKLFYMVKYLYDESFFKYEGYNYSIVFKLSTTNGDYFANNPTTVACCCWYCEQIIIGINPKLLSSYRNTITQYGDYGKFVWSETYKAIERKIEPILAHEITHAQLCKYNINSEVEVLENVDETDICYENKFNDKTVTDFEKSVVYWFCPQERQARLSEGYVKLKNKLRKSINLYGNDFAKFIKADEIYSCLYEETSNNKLENLYQKLISSPTEDLTYLLTHKSAVFSPRTNNLHLEHKRIIRRLASIREYNKKKLIKVAGKIKEELNEKNKGKRF